MKYYTYNEPKEDGSDGIYTVSEVDILKVYKPYFLRQMKKITREIPETSDELILDNWIVINWAWETDINGNKLKLT